MNATLGDQQMGNMTTVHLLSAVKIFQEKYACQKAIVYRSRFFAPLYQRKIKTESGALNERGSCAGPWFEAQLAT